MTLQQAKILALKVLKQVMEEKLDHNNVQLAQVGQDPLALPSSTPVASSVRGCVWTERGSVDND